MLLLKHRCSRTSNISPKATKKLTAFLDNLTQCIYVEKSSSSELSIWHSLVIIIIALMIIVYKSITSITNSKHFLSSEISIYLKTLLIWAAMKKEIILCYNWMFIECSKQTIKSRSSLRHLCKRKTSVLIRSFTF